MLVRPLAGAGIEIVDERCSIGIADVRPLAGAGIEIPVAAIAAAVAEFAPSRGRELKFRGD